MPSGSSTADLRAARPARPSRAGRRGARASRRATPALLALALALGAGCGGGQDDDSRTEQDAPRPRALTQTEVLRVGLGTPQLAVLAQLGPPSASGPPRLRADRCLYWRIVHQPRTALWRLCFRHGRLHIISSYISSLHLFLV